MKYELISKTLNPLRNIFWYIVPGTTVSWVLSGEQMYPPLYYFDYLFEEAFQEWNKPRCSVCKTTENVRYVGSHE